MGHPDRLYLGDMDAKRDLGYSGDYVKAMWLMLQQETAEDYIPATGTMVSGCDFISLTFERTGIELEFPSMGVDDIGVDKNLDALCSLWIRDTSGLRKW